MQDRIVRTEKGGLDTNSVKNAFVTVIMPIRNEATFIARSMRAVLDQDYPHDLIELLVVDGVSNDGTQGIVQDIIAQAPHRDIKILSNPERYAPHAFNLGIRNARGEVIVIIGGHTIIAPDYIRSCVSALAATGADCVGGVLETRSEGRSAEAIALAQQSRFGVGGVAFRTGAKNGVFVDTVAFGAYRRSVFQHIGLFDEELIRNQDDELNFRLTQAGGKIWLDPKIRCVYFSRATLRRLWQQYFDYGCFKLRVAQKRGGLPAWRHAAPGLFVLTLAFMGGVSLLTAQSIWFLIIATPYVGASMVAALWSGRKNWRAASLLPLAFGTLHFAYGTGFLWGIWRWRRGWHQKGGAPRLSHQETDC